MQTVCILIIPRNRVEESLQQQANKLLASVTLKRVSMEAHEWSAIFGLIYLIGAVFIESI